MDAWPAVVKAGVWRMMMMSIFCRQKFCTTNRNDPAKLCLGGCQTLIETHCERPTVVSANWEDRDVGGGLIPSNAGFSRSGTILGNNILEELFMEIIVSKA